jgi:GntR family transcriptional repressor for pyruvate dehydrogenase complex
MSSTGRSVPKPIAAVRRAPSPSTEVTRHLLQYLLSGDLKLGQKLPSERQLAEALGIGRSGVREAIKSLNLLGLLEVRQGDGTYLTGSTSDLLPEVIEWGLMLGERNVLDLVEVREHLEVFIAGLAAQRHSSEDLAELWDAVAKMESAESDPDRYIEGDVQFHRVLARATENEVLSNLSHSFSSLMQVWAARCAKAEKSTTILAAEHDSIAKAVEKSDPDAARAAMSTHMQEARMRLDSLPEKPAATPGL